MVSMFVKSNRRSWALVGSTYEAPAATLDPSCMSTVFEKVYNKMSTHWLEYRRVGRWVTSIVK